MTYLDEIADRIRVNLAPEAHPPADADVLFLIYAVLVRAKGESTTLEDVHDAWTAWMRTVQPKHKSLIPFSDLSPAVQKEDLPYLGAIHRTAVQLNLHPSQT